MKTVRTRCLTYAGSSVVARDNGMPTGIPQETEQALYPLECYLPVCERPTPSVLDPERPQGDPARASEKEALPASALRTDHGLGVRTAASFAPVFPVPLMGTFGGAAARLTRNSKAVLVTSE